MYQCPVCQYPKLKELPDNNYGICPQCGTEFGYDDDGKTHEELRSEWIAGGSKWWSSIPQNKRDAS